MEFSIFVGGWVSSCYPYNYIVYRLSMMCLKRFVDAAVVKTIVDESIDVIQLIYSFAIAPPPTLPAASGSSSFMSVICSVADPLNFDTAPDPRIRFVE